MAFRRKPAGQHRRVLATTPSPTGDGSEGSARDRLPHRLPVTGSHETPRGPSTALRPLDRLRSAQDDTQGDAQSFFNRLLKPSPVWVAIPHAGPALRFGTLPSAR